MRARIKLFAQNLSITNYSMATFISRKAEILRMLAEASHEMRDLRPVPAIAQGIKGSAELITGNFKTFTEAEASAISASLKRGKTLVILFDRDYIPVPANERAGWIRHHFAHNPNLEVRVAYAPPAEHVMDNDMTYLTQHTPAGIQISAVSCMESYSAKLAKHLSVPHRKHAYCSAITSAVAKKRVHHPFSGIISAEKFEALIAKTTVGLKQHIIELNALHPNFQHLFERTEWDLRQLNRRNLPFQISNIDSPTLRAAFSDPFQTQVFDMPIYMPGQGWKIPAEFTGIAPIIATIAAAERLANPGIADCKAYITIDSGIVPPNEFARRKDRHVDGFKTNANAGDRYGDNTYIISDREELQTEFYPGPFDLSQVDVNNPRAVLAAFAEQGKDMPFYQGNAYSIYKLTVNNVHAVHQNDTHRCLQRNFVKVTFSERDFNRSGNTINPFLNYRYLYVPRTAERNTQNYIGIVPAGFTEVKLSDIDFTNNRYPEWVVPQPFQIRKNPNVTITAVPAITGETLPTIVDGTLITTNVAREGDIKVMRENGDSYFLGKNFHTLYQRTTANRFKPTDRTLVAVRVNKPVSFVASWGTLQNIPAGGVIVQDKQNEKWGIHEQSFKATYLKV